MTHKAVEYIVESTESLAKGAYSAVVPVLGIRDMWTFIEQAVQAAGEVKVSKTDRYVPSYLIEGTYNGTPFTLEVYRPY